MESGKGIPKAVGSHRKIWIQGALSLWVVLHCLAVLITPNGNTYLGRIMSTVLKPYANFFELSANWNFFAPQPGPPMRLEFEVLDAEGGQLLHDFWPDLKSPWRQVTLSHFVMKDSNAGEKIAGKFICSQHSSAKSIRVWRNIYGIPRLDEVESGSRVIGDDVQVSRQFMGEWHCDKGAAT